MSNQMSLSVFSLKVRPEPCISNEANFSLELRKSYNISGQIGEIALITTLHNVAQTEGCSAIKMIKRQNKENKQHMNGNITKIMSE